jgi:hypothetical protein
MYIVMAPFEKRVEKKTDADGGDAPAAETIGDAIAAKGTVPQVTTETPAQQGS